MPEANSPLLVITLNVNGLSSSIKKQRLLEWIFKMIKLYAVYKKLTLVLKTQVDIKRWKEMFCTKNSQKKSWSGYINIEKIKFKQNKNCCKR